MASSIPQHLSLLTLGAWDFPGLTEFYRSWGWTVMDGSTEEWCAFDVGGCLLSLYPIGLLGNEAAPDEPAPAKGWRGFTLAINLRSEEQLRRAFAAAVDAGATCLSEPTKREWGGVSGYVADPEGNRWELACGGPNPAPA